MWIIKQSYIIKCLYTFKKSLFIIAFAIIKCLCLGFAWFFLSTSLLFCFNFSYLFCACLLCKSCCRKSSLLPCSYRVLLLKIFFSLPSPVLIQCQDSLSLNDINSFYHKFMRLKTNWVKFHSIFTDLPFSAIPDYSERSIIFKWYFHLCSKNTMLDFAKFFSALL